MVTTMAKKLQDTGAAPAAAAQTEDEDVVDLALRIFSEHLAACGAPAIDLDPVRRQMRSLMGGMRHYARSDRPSTEERAQAVLEALSRGGKSVTQVGRELGISRTAAYRLRQATAKA